MQNPQPSGALEKSVLVGVQIVRLIGRVFGIQ
jgi:hypothetical protein